MRQTESGASTGPATENGNRNPKICVRDLAAHYGDKVVLDHISLDVFPQETMVVLGGSGCGKSTFLRCLIGLHRPTAGEIFVDDLDVAKAHPEDLGRLRKKFGVLFQGAALFNSMTVADNVALPLREHTQLDESVINIMVRIKLELVGLSGSEHLLPSQLSGGMKKRAGLARAMAMDPEILFFDEPSAGLDPRVSADIDELILKLKRAFDITMVVVTHEIKSAFRIADRITMFDQGKILFIGAPDEMRECADERVKQFLEGAPHGDGGGARDYLDGILA